MWSNLIFNFLIFCFALVFLRFKPETPSLWVIIYMRWQHWLEIYIFRKHWCRGVELWWENIGLVPFLACTIVNAAHLDVSKNLLNMLLYSIKFQNITSIELISNRLFMAAFGLENLIKNLVNSYKYKLLDLNLIINDNIWVLRIFILFQ